MTVAEGLVLRPTTALRGSLELPSDKSISHRALICAALAGGRSYIELRDPGADVRSTIAALSSLGVALSTRLTDDFVGVDLEGLGTDESIGALAGGTGDCGNSGTSMRLLTGALASGSGVATLIGDDSLNRRPMERVAAPLREMGTEIDLDSGHAPVVVRGRRPLRAAEHKLSVASAQVLGAISLAALAADGTTTVQVPGHVRDHTERILAALGAKTSRVVGAEGTVTTINGPTGLRSFRTRVQGDMSSAAAWLVGGAIYPNSNITLRYVGLNPSRTGVIDVLRAMGADIVVDEIPATLLGEPIGDVYVRGGERLRPVSLSEADVAPLIDELPLLAVAMAAADGTSEVRGASELRVKESDRISAMAAALTAAGAKFEELPDGWRIAPGKPREANVVTHGDHRIAISMAIAAWTGVAASVVLDDADCVAVSYPTFWSDASLVGAKS